MEKAMVWAAWLFGAYLAGSVPFGFLIGKMRGVDVRTVGSKNIGATNVFRTVGKKWGLLAFLCDFLKGFVPVILARTFGGEAHLPLAVGLMTVVGHMFTCFMKFKGGKGIATGFGMLVGLVPWLVLTAFGIWAVTVWLSHYISLGSCVAAAFLAVGVWFPWLGSEGWRNLPLSIVVTLVAIVAIYKHKANIRRLIDGCENKIY
ncbi:MAG: glycerol-3-phosphate 1-O-acyltransferase PlsY [Eggerthellaceae bacterium]|nr:glycerol-3-phosphate 1-O-acyltransferase PlsY [Eggerthellaceae bacterium]